MDQKQYTKRSNRKRKWKYFQREEERKRKEEHEQQFECRLYVRFPLSIKYSEERLRQLFQPFCPLKRVKQMDWNAACVTLDDCALFATYDDIHFKLISKGNTNDYQNFFVDQYEKVMSTSEYNFEF